MRALFPRSAFAALPLLAFVSFAACADNGSSNDETVPDGGGDSVAPPNGDGGTDGETPSTASCTVTKKGTEGLLIKGRMLLPESIVDGELLIDGKGIILCADQSCSAAPALWSDAAAYKAAYAAATELTCKDAVVSPGLINPHDHISFANVPPKPHGKERYEHRHDWRKGLEGHQKISTAPATGSDSHMSTRLAELRFLMSGVTAGATAGGENGLMRNVDGSPAQFESALRLRTVNSDTFPLGDSKPPAGWPNITDCSGFSASRTTADSLAKYDSYLPHISEGVNAVARLEFTCQSDAAGDPTHDLVTKKTAIVHGVGLDADDIAKYHDAMTVLVWSPRSNVDLYGNTAEVVAYDNLGVQIALGTDWLPSGSMNMSRELRCADSLNQTYFAKHFSDKALWQMVTVNGAAAIGASNALGSLKPGYAGDVSIFDASTSKDYRAVIDAGVEDVLLVLRGGKVLYGDANVLAADGVGGSACEDLDVCGRKKKACVKQDLGSVTLAQLQDEAAKVYPLFFCKKDAPKDEPSCAPSRGPTAAYPSASVYDAPAAGDKDGDGVPDAKDDCPDVFNPIRPQDGDKQADTDGDGVGDACDKCPTTAGEACTPPSAADVDGDGVPNGVDNCPKDANPKQEDGDKDGHGDACDACPSDANPGMALCPNDYQVSELRDPSNPKHPASGSVRARVKDLYVTGVVSVQHTLGFFAQANTGGAAFSALFVKTDPDGPSVKVGNKVDVEGDYEEIFGLTMLTSPKISVTDPGTTLPFAPVVVTTQAVTDTDKAGNGASAEQFEGMLCEVDAVKVVAMNADAPKDYDELTVADATGVALRVDDYVYDPLDNTYPADTAFSKIVGICGLSYTHRKIWPRAAGDLAP